MAKQEDSFSAPLNVKEKQGETEQDAHDNAAVLIYTTFPSLSDAKSAGAALVEARLAACVNIIPQMTAIYLWEGKLEESSEAAMIVKTAAARSQAVLEEIKRLHPYSLPARLVLPVTGGGADFLAWISKQCGAK
ncbi:MAG: divalent-cation tolerance protein CutA [Rhodomicrobium sp.]|nr:divalent-cation tolerance protein CutA [Rhodomicrobium sp.]